MWIKLSNLFNKESELTKDEQNWNFKADKFNDLIMKNDPNPATNKKRLRKKYKPRKLTQKEVYDLYLEGPYSPYWWAKDLGRKLSRNPFQGFEKPSNDSN